MTKIELAKLVGITERQVRNIDKEAGEDEKLFKRSEDGSGYDPAFFVRQWVKRQVRITQHTWTKKELAELTGLTYRRIADIDAEQEESFFKDDRQGGYDAPTFVQRWAQYLVRKEQEEGGDLQEIKAKHEKVKMQKTQLEVKRIEGQLVEAQDVEAHWLDIANTVRQGFVQFGAHTAPLVAGVKDKDAVESILDREARRILEALSENALPESQEPQEEDDEA